jgi:hypothetical protein
MCERIEGAIGIAEDEAQAQATMRGAARAQEDLTRVIARLAAIRTPRNARCLRARGAGVDAQEPVRLADDVFAADRISEHYPVRSDLELADLGVVRARARLDHRHGAQQA